MKKCPYWTREALEAAGNAKTFTELGELALATLRSFPESREGIFQVCGPISTGGFNNQSVNFLVLAEAVRHYRERGFLVFDQTPLERHFVRLWEEWKLVNEGYCWPILLEVYRPLFRSGLVRELHFLPDWESSTGSRWERQEGGMLGITVRDYPQEIYEKIKADHSL